MDGIPLPSGTGSQSAGDFRFVSVRKGFVDLDSGPVVIGNIEYRII